MRVWLLAVLCSCGSTQSYPCAGALDAIVIGSDYTSSIVGGLDVLGNVSATPGVDLGGDPVLAMSSGRAFLLARDTGALFELDPRCGKPVSEISVRDVGMKSTPNPHDAAADENGIYVTRYDVPSLFVIPNSGSPYSIDLSSLDPDGNPQPEGVYVIGGKAFVTLEMLDKDLFSRRPSKMAVIDLATRTIANVVPLKARNPFGRIVFANGKLWLAAMGNADVANEKDAGIERFDPVTMTSEMVVSETYFGRSVLEVSVSGTCLAAVVCDPTPKINATSLYLYDLEKKQATQILATTDGFDLRGILLTERELFYGDRRKTSTGYVVRVLPRHGCKFEPTEQKSGSFPLPPVAIGQP